MFDLLLIFQKLLVRTVIFGINYIKNFIFDNGTESSASNRLKKAVREAKEECSRHKLLPLTISVIIPCYNEADSIERCLSMLLTNESIQEVIVSDGGSKDNSLSLLKSLSCLNSKLKIITSGNSRSSCLNAAAEFATGDILLFLHADTYFSSPSFPSLILSTLQQPEVIVGAFQFQLEPHTSWKLSLIEYVTNLRSSMLQLPYGDQALFVYKSVFTALGSFPNQIFMEDFDFVLRARSLGRIKIAPLPVITSARRWSKVHGELLNTLRNQVYTVQSIGN